MTREQIETLEKAVEQQKERNTQYRVYTEKDCFVYNGRDVFSVLDYWRFRFSQLLGQQESIAEFLVGQALDLQKAENVNYWTAYDLSYRGKRIEVKATCYIHPWDKRISRVRSFSIAPSNNRYWQELPGQDSGARMARQSEVYVFCLNTDQDIEHPNPLMIDNWEFYVVPTYRINEYCQKAGNPEQRRITLAVVRRLAKQSCLYVELRDSIEKAIVESDQHYLGE